jgi:hypothetical protein
MMASLSMQDVMYSEECQLVGWSATKFDEGPLAGYISMDFYIKGERQSLYNELKWYLLDEFITWFPDATYKDKFTYVKKHLPSDAVYYNVVHDKRKIITELKGRIKELKELKGMLEKTEKDDIRTSLQFYKNQKNAGSGDVMYDMLQQLMSNF